MTQVVGEGYLEIDINVHKYSSIPKQALQMLYPKLASMSVVFGFCVESREDSDMPETLTGCVTMNKIDVSRAVEFKVGIIASSIG